MNRLVMCQLEMRFVGISLALVELSVARLRATRIKTSCDGAAAPFITVVCIVKSHRVGYVFKVMNTVWIGEL